MTTRELDVSEWSKLKGTELETVWPHLSPRFARIIVAEEEGRIVGQVALLTFLHADGLGVAPDHRRKGTVWRALMKAVGRLAGDIHVRGFLAGAASDEMHTYLQRLGGRPLEASFYAVPINRYFGVKETGSCRGR